MLRNRNEVERAVKNVNATLSFEGLTPSKNAERLKQKNAKWRNIRRRCKKADSFKV